MGNRLNRIPKRRRFVAAAAVFVIAFLAGLAFIRAYPLPEPRNDAVEYLAIARSVAAGTGFSSDGGTTPEVYRPPLFPALLGGWFRLTGASSVLSAALFQSVVHALGAAAALLLFLEIGASPALAAGASAVLAANPLLVTRVVFVLQEPTVLLLTILAAWASARLVRAPSAGRAALAGAAWGVCALAKVVCAFAPFLLLGMRCLPRRSRVAWRWTEAALLLLCFAAAIAPWTARNYRHFHRFIPVNGQERGLLEWNVEQARIPGERPGSEVLAEIKGRSLPGKEERAALWEYIRSRPRHFLVDRTVRNAIHFAAPPRDWWIARGSARPGEHGTGYWILAALFHLPLYVVLFYRTWQWGRGRLAPAYGFLVLLYWAYWAVHAILWGDPRYGLAVYPLLAGMLLPGGRPSGRLRG